MSKLFKRHMMGNPILDIQNAATQMGVSIKWKELKRLLEKYSNLDWLEQRKAVLDEIAQMGHAEPRRMMIA